MKRLIAQRLPGNPVITPAMLPGDEGANINGPSLIATPEWLPRRLGRYYLYFAHHAGTSIRLAYADVLSGPWTVHPPGTLQLAEAPGCQGHIASPDVHIDELARRIVMYFHGPLRGRGAQKSFFAASVDGLSFSASATPLAPFYLRVVRYGARWIGMARGGQMFLADDWEGPFVRLKQPAFSLSRPIGDGAGGVRHVALDVRGDTLWVYFTRIGDSPERVLRAPIDLQASPQEWRAGPPEEVMAPETEWEGADLPVVRSWAGIIRRRQHALRDPALFREAGRTYLVYSVAGEAGIGIAELI